ncbi:MAG: outer membrane beta-barrel protein [Desulfosoma sp.]|uniref:outer membrane beta-barrel protein n=1 Tax=Desulfosoma sp. TaxID=2603217 RepID=UPI004049E548
MRRAQVLMCCVLLIGAVPSGVFAGYRHVITPRIDLTSEYSSNIYQTHKDQKSDFITVVAPGLSYQVSDRRQGFEVGYSPGYAAYAKNQDESGFRHDLHAMAWHYFSQHLRMTFTDRFTRTEEPYRSERESLRFRKPSKPIEVDGIVVGPVDAEEPYDATRRKGRYMYNSNAATVQMVREFGEGRSVDVSYVNRILRNEDPTLQDSVQNTAGVGLRYQFTPLITGRTRLDYTRGTFSGGDMERWGMTEDFDRWRGLFEVRRAFTPRLQGFVEYTQIFLDERRGNDDYVVYSPAVGLDYQISPGAAVTAGVGYYLQERKVGEDKDGLIFFLEGDVGESWRDGRLTARLTTQSGFQETYFGAENLGFAAYYGTQGTVTYAFTKKITGNGFALYRRDEYLNEDPVRKDDTYLAGTGISFRLRRWVSLRLRYYHRMVDSNIAEQDTDEDNVGFNLNFDLSPKLRPFTF